MLTITFNAPIEIKAHSTKSYFHFIVLTAANLSLFKEMLRKNENPISSPLLLLLVHQSLSVTSVLNQLIYHDLRRAAQLHPVSFWPRGPMDYDIKNARGS